MIKVVSANLERRQLDYQWVNEGSSRAKPASKKSNRKNKKEKM
jgi:hypothetical protein